MVALLLVCSCRPHGRASGASLQLPANAADQARRFQLPRSPTGDSDRDGVPDRDDGCPNELEFYDGKADLDGCPDGGHGVVQIDEEEGAIELAFGHALEFAEDDRLLEWRHEETLEQVAWFLRAHPRFTVVEIAQIDVGCDGFDCDRHAEWVRLFLLTHGIESDRIDVRPRLGGLGHARDDAFPHAPTSRVELSVRRRRF